MVQYRSHGSNTTKRVTIGVHGAPWTTDRAREAAERLLLQVAIGEDPAATARANRDAAEAARRVEEARQQAEQEAAGRAVAHRFEAVLEDYIERYAKPKNRRRKDTRSTSPFTPSPSGETGPSRPSRAATWSS